MGMIEIKEEDWKEFREYVQHLETRIKFIERTIIPEVYDVVAKLTHAINQLAQSYERGKNGRKDGKWWEKEW